MAKIVPIDCLVCKAFETPEHPATEASVIVRVNGGCNIVANVVQALCEQHWLRLDPQGSGGAKVLIELGKEQMNQTGKRK